MKRRQSVAAQKNKINKKKLKANTNFIIKYSPNKMNKKKQRKEIHFFYSYSTYRYLNTYTYIHAYVCILMCIHVCMIREGCDK